MLVTSGIDYQETSGVVYDLHGACHLYTYAAVLTWWGCLSSPDQ